MFKDPTPYLWLIPLLPLVGSAVIALLGPRWLKGKSHWPCILGAAGACFFSVLTLICVANGYPSSPAAEKKDQDAAEVKKEEGAKGEAKAPPHQYVAAGKVYYTWFQAGPVDVTFALRADGLTAIMLVTVTFIGALIAIFAVGYMHGEKGYPRFFGAVSLFLFAMTLLVMADNFILLYAGWEGVGVCSYLLIGFWFNKPSAAAAARKAFLVTRLGDIGLFLGILILWAKFDSFDFDTIFRRALGGGDYGLITAACLLLFMGAAGKSAQFPLHVWLPDAMEGPTPVSALIHAATMVTAGVYLVARCTPLFAMVPLAQLVVAFIAGLTALMAAIIALTQTDLKKVLAYSTISQLGYMFLALGSATTDRVRNLAVTAAIFHLVTHAFFKALLFLASGSVMHSMGGVIDMRRFGGLRKVLPITHWTFLCGALALAGFPLLSGFWSKDEILAATNGAAHGLHAPWIYEFLLITALVTAGLTAFYTFRAYFLTFWGEERIPQEAGHHAHESPRVMTYPLMILAVGALLVGAILGPTHLLAHFFDHHWLWSEGAAGWKVQLPPQPVSHGLNWALMGISTVIALAGIVLAWLFYVKKPALPGKVSYALQGAYELSQNKFYLDELFAALVVKPMSALAYIFRVVDFYIVDGLVDLVGQVPSFIGFLFRPVQNGLVQFYALLMALGAAGFLLSVLLR